MSQASEPGRIRVSYSILYPWSKGDYQEAVERWQGNWGAMSNAQAAGRAYHEIWEKEVKKTNNLPDIFGGQKLGKPIIEEKTVHHIPGLDWLEWVQKPDVLDPAPDPTDYYEFKTGVTSASQYAGSYQMKTAQIGRPSLKRGHVLAHNQHSDSNSVAVIHLSSQTLRDGLEWVITFASELREYLINNGLLEE